MSGDDACCVRPSAAPCCDLAPLLGICKALADETRLKLLSLLAGAPGPLCVCELEVGVDVSQPTVSHHLKVLREAGLLTSERRGTWMYYAINPQCVAALDVLVAALKKGSTP